jgi:Holliday junction resolvase-like predicted endonuclease
VHLRGRKEGVTQRAEFAEKIGAFTETRGGHSRDDQAALPGLSVTAEKQQGRTPGVFLNERRVRECPVHFDVLAIEEDSGRMPVVRSV